MITSEWDDCFTTEVKMGGAKLFSSKFFWVRTQLEKCSYKKNKNPIIKIDMYDRSFCATELYLHNNFRHMVDKKPVTALFTAMMYI
jgi:hypothetical protein